MPCLIATVVSTSYMSPAEKSHGNRANSMTRTVAFVYEDVFVVYLSKDKKTGVKILEVSVLSPCGSRLWL